MGGSIEAVRPLEPLTDFGAYRSITEKLVCAYYMRKHFDKVARTSVASSRDPQHNGILRHRLMGWKRVDAERLTKDAAGSKRAVIAVGCPPHSPVTAPAETLGRCAKSKEMKQIVTLTVPYCGTAI